MKSFVRTLKSLASEFGCRLQVQRRGPRPAILIFPGRGGPGSASDLRARSIAAPLRRLGHRVLIVPPILDLPQRQRLCSSFSPDVIMYQKCRDPLHDPALFPGAIHVVDVDDADYLDPNLASRMRRVASSCAGAIAGSRTVADWLKQYCDEVHVVWTGTPLSARRPRTPPSRRHRRVVFACSDLRGYPEETRLVRDVALQAARTVQFELLLIGKADPSFIESEFRVVRQAGIPVVHLGLQPYSRLVSTLESAAVALAPLCSTPGNYSEGKSFGKVLAYLCAGVPIICSQAGEYPLFFQDGRNGILVRDDPTTWADRITALLDSPCDRDVIAMNASNDLASRLSTQAAAAGVAAAIRSITQFAGRRST